MYHFKQYMPQRDMNRLVLSSYRYNRTQITNQMYIPILNPERRFDLIFCNIRHINYSIKLYCSYGFADTVFSYFIIHFMVFYTKNRYGLIFDKYIVLMTIRGLS